MREKINAMANGNIAYELPHLIVGPDKLVCRVEAGKRFHGCLNLSNSLKRPMKGICYSSHPALELMSTRLVGTNIKLEYQIHGEYLSEKDSLSGEISFTMDCGELEIPFRIDVVSPTLLCSEGELRNLQEFTMLAQRNWREAVRVFHEGTFRSFLEHHEPKYIHLWEHVRRSASVDQSLEEFLVKTGQKLEVSFYVEKDALQYEMGGNEIADHIVINKNNWGFLRMQVSSTESFLTVEQAEITSDDFAGNRYELLLRIRPDRLTQGNYSANLILESCTKRVEISVSCHREQEPYLLSTGKKLYERGVAKLMENHLQYALRRIPVGRYISEAEGILDQIDRYSSPEQMEKRLYRVYLNRLSGRENAANNLMRGVSEEELRRSSVAAQGFYLYLKAERSQSNKAELLEQLLQLCREHPEVPQVSLLMLSLDERYAKSPRMKLEELQALFESGCGSPFLYLAAAEILCAEPALLHELDAFTMQVLYFAVKRSIITKDAALQVAYLVEHSREFHPLCFKILSGLYERFATQEILSAICYLLIHEGRKEPGYAVWYQRGVQEQLRVSELYEYYIYTIEPDEEQQLDPAVLMYFVYNSRLSEERLAFLFANVVCHKESNRPVYDSYRERIHQYALVQMRAGKNSHHLSILYRDCLADSESRTEALAYLPRVAFCHEIRCENQAVKYVCVTHRELQEEILSPLINGVAQVNIYSPQALISLIDAYGNRLLTGIPYECVRLLHAEECYNDAYRLSPESSLLLLCLAGKAQAEARFDAVSVELRRRAIRLSEISEDFRYELVHTLVLYYYDNCREEMLEEYLTELKETQIPKKQRAKIMSLLILRGQDERALSMLLHFDAEGLEPRLLEALCLRLSPEIFRQHREQIIRLMYWAFARGRRSDKLVASLVENYQGTTDSMYRLWQEAVSMKLPCEDLEERLLAQILFTETNLGYADEIFNHYQKPGSNRQLVRAYLTYTAYKYLLEDVPIGEQTLRFMKHDVYSDENDVCILALLRVVSEKEDLTEEEQSFAEYWLLKMEAKGKVLPVFCRLSKYFKLPDSLEDKVLIEYRTNPANRVTLHYTYRYGGKRKQLDFPMRNVCHGIFVKEVVLFEEESIEYVISEEGGGKSVVSDKVVLNGEGLYHNSNSRFGRINAIIAARRDEDKEKTLELLNEYVKDSFAISQLFHEILDDTRQN